MKVKKMYQLKSDIPTPLQTRVLIQIALAIILLLAGIILLFLMTWLVTIPFLFLSLLLALDGCRICCAAVQGRCLVLSGTVLKVERTAILHRPKALLTEIDGKALRVVLRSRWKIPTEGSRIMCYVLDTTPIYEWRGIHLLSSYLVLAEMPADTFS